MSPAPNPATQVLLAAIDGTGDVGGSDGGVVGRAVGAGEMVGTGLVGGPATVGPELALGVGVADGTTVAAGLDGVAAVGGGGVTASVAGAPTGNEDIGVTDGVAA